jgi:MoaA/NifB/PqqE/SkfB family radical SAM enzyme
VKVELEITSDCNAACPGCARTLNKDKLEINSFSLQDLQRIFPTQDYTNYEFKFCGVLGDPIVNPDFLDMVKYLTDLGGYCEVSTNGGYNTAKWWSELGSIAAKHPGLVHIHFCIDGHKETNHIYRVNTKWNIVERNIAAFAETAPEKHATWIYIVFDHNEHELPTAKAHATVLGFEFATRTGMRNSYHQWIAKVGKKNKKQSKTITTTGKKEHSKKDVVKDLDKFITEYKANKSNKKQTDEILKTVVCKYIHEDEIFIASNQTMWPCCFLWDSAFKNKEDIIYKLNHFDPGWNDLKQHTINEIKNHEWFSELLEASWEPTHPLHFTRCIRTCAKNKAYHNEINYAVN